MYCFNTILFRRWVRKSNRKNAKADGVRTIYSQFDPIFQKAGKLKIKQLDSAPNMTSTQIITQHTQITPWVSPPNQSRQKILHSSFYSPLGQSTNFLILEALYRVWWPQSDCFLKQPQTVELLTQLNRTVIMDNSLSCLFWLLFFM